MCGGLISGAGNARERRLLALPRSPPRRRFSANPLLGVASFVAGTPLVFRLGRTGHEKTGSPGREALEAGRSRLLAAVVRDGGLSEPLPARTSIASSRAAPVLVTGAHRSGTTWVGSTLAADEQILYLPEPFNLDHLYPGLCGARFPCWFMRIDADNEEAYRDDIARRLDFCWRDAVAATARSPKASVRTARIARVLRRARGERCDFANFASQPALLDHDVAPFAADIQAAARHRLDAVAEAGLLWRCPYATVDRYHRERPDWLFLRHEDVSARPVYGFQAMCRHLGIAYSPPIANEVSRTTSPGNPVDARPGDVHALLRDSRRATANWRPRMDPGDIAKLRSSVEDVSSGFYTDVEWPE